MMNQQFTSYIRRSIWGVVNRFFTFCKDKVRPNESHPGVHIAIQLYVSPYNVYLIRRYSFGTGHFEVTCDC